MKNITLSAFVENNLRLLLSEDELDKSFKSIGIKYNYTSPDAIVKEREKMKLVAPQKIIDEIRDEMDDRLI